MARTANEIKKEITIAEKEIVTLEGDLKATRKVGGDPSYIHKRIDRLESFLDNLRKELESVQATEQDESDDGYEKILKMANHLKGGSVIRESQYEGKTPFKINDKHLVKIKTMQKSIRDFISRKKVKIVQDKEGDKCITVEKFYEIINKNNK